MYLYLIIKYGISAISCFTFHLIFSFYFFYYMDVISYMDYFLAYMRQ